MYIIYNILEKWVPYSISLMKGYMISDRFRGFLPVIVDIESGGFNPETDALLEIAVVLISYVKSDGWRRDRTLSFHVEPFEGANLDRRALDFNKIDPSHPFRHEIAQAETNVLSAIKKEVVCELTKYNCSRAILVGHNASFDLGFLNAAVKRVGIKGFPFHSFSTFDTATLAGLVFGQTVLARAMQVAGFQWDVAEAHSAAYDAEGTADLFCEIVNKWDNLDV